MKKNKHKLIKNFEKKFGKPENTIYVMGDYDKGSYHMKGKRSLRFTREVVEAT